MEEKTPKPPKARPQAPDRRNEYLKEWKKLFQDLDKEIEVVIYGDPHFEKLFDSLFQCKRRYYDYDYDEDFIIIKVPWKFSSDGSSYYLIGRAYDHMFVANEEWDDNPHPKTFSWEYFYQDIHRVAEEQKQEIPKPPAQQA